VISYNTFSMISIFIVLIRYKLYGDAEERLGNGLLSLRLCCAFSSQKNIITQV